MAKVALMLPRMQASVWRPEQTQTLNPKPEALDPRASTHLDVAADAGPVEWPNLLVVLRHHLVRHSCGSAGLVRRGRPCVEDRRVAIGLHRVSRWGQWLREKEKWTEGAAPRQQERTAAGEAV